MRAIFVDAGAWIALPKRDDTLHVRAREFYDRLYSTAVGLLTTNYVVDETATRLRYDIGLHAALDFRSRLAALCQIRRARILWIDERLETEGWRILEQYADVPLSLTDATSAAAAHANRVTDVFGFDRDFEALGFVVMPGLS